MSNRFHNKFHRHNHHTEPTDRDGQFPDSAYDPIASPDSPFRGEFYIDGNITTLSSVSALGDLFASNGTFHEDVTIEGNLSVLGTTTQLDTFVYVTSALDSTNVGTGPALKVTQSGNQPIANFIDSNGDDIIFADNGYVGLGTTSPNEKLTVIGNISATGNTITDGNSYLSGSSFIVNDLTVDTDTLFVDSINNKVGIGTLEPNQQLTVIGNISATGSQNIDQHLTVGILSAGLTNQVVIHNNNTLESREINSRVWDTAAEFLSGRNLAVGYLPMYSGPNTLVDSPIEYDGVLTTIRSDTTVTGNLTSLGDAYFANTLFTTTSSLSIVNTGPGPALYVYQAAGAYDVASFYDGDGIEVLHVGNSFNPSGNGRIGINTSNPNAELTVTGSISATQDIDITGRYLSGGIDILFLISQSVSAGSAASNDYTHANFLPLSGGNLTGSVTLSTSSVSDAFRITQSGPGNALVVEDSENSDSTPFVITNTGRIGIGTFSPISKLNIVEDNENAFRISNDETHEYYASFGCTLSAGYFTAGTALTRDVPLVFRTSLAGAETERVRFAASGNVGIGTPNPNKKLTVIGDISATGNISTDSQFLSAGVDLFDIFSSISTGGLASGAYLPLSGGTVTGSVTVTGTVFAESFVLTTPGLIVFDTVSAAAIPVTTLPIIGNDVELYSTTAVTITAFQNGIKGTLYTLTNKGTGTVTITASPTNFVRNGQSWSNRYIELSTNYACSLRADINNVVSIW